MDSSLLKESNKLIPPLISFLIKRNTVLGNRPFSGLVEDLYYVYTIKGLEVEDYKRILKQKRIMFYSLKSQIDSKKLQIKMSDNLTTKHLLLLDIVQLYEEIEYLSL